MKDMDLLTTKEIAEYLAKRKKVERKPRRGPKPQPPLRPTQRSQRTETIERVYAGEATTLRKLCNAVPAGVELIDVIIQVENTYGDCVDGAIILECTREVVNVDYEKQMAAYLIKHDKYTRALALWEMGGDGEEKE